MSRSNCLIFGLVLYYRRYRKGKQGYLISRRSHWGWFPHFMYCRIRVDGSLQLVGYSPISPTRHRLPPPVFKGRVKWGDL